MATIYYLILTGGLRICGQPVEVKQVSIQLQYVEVITQQDTILIYSNQKTNDGKLCKITSFGKVQICGIEN